MKFNWLFFFEFLALIMFVQIMMQALNITGVVYYVVCFCLGFFADNLFSWLHGREMKMFSLDKDNEIK